MNQLDQILRVIFDNLYKPTQPEPGRIISRYTDVRDMIIAEDEVSVVINDISRSRWGDASEWYATYDENTDEVVWL